MRPDLLERYRDWWTRLFAKFRYGGVTGEATLTTRDGNQPVYCVSSDSAYIGQKTPGAATIIINRNRFDELPELSAERVVEHEIGHLQRHPILRVFLWTSIIMMAIGIVFLTILLVIIGISEVTAESNLRLIVSLVGMVMLGPIAFRVDELAAELHVLNHLSPEEYYRADEMIPEYDDTSMIAVAIAKIIYPHPRTVVKIHRIKQGLSRMTPRLIW